MTAKARTCAETDIQIPQTMHEQWNIALAAMADALGVCVALLMRVKGSRAEILSEHCVAVDFYKPGDCANTAEWTYCAEVIRRRRELFVPDARAVDRWSRHPTVKKGLVCYLGQPLFWPDGKAFGVIAVLDREEKHFTLKQRRAFARFRQIVQTSLGLLYEHNSVLTKALDEAAHASSLVRESRLFRLLHEAAGGLDILFGPDGRVLWVSPSVRFLTGKTAEECLAMTDFPYRFIHPNDRPAITDMLATRDQSVKRENFRFVRPGKNAVWCRGVFRKAGGGQFLLSVSEDEPKSYKNQNKAHFLQRVQQMGGVAGWEMNVTLGVIVISAGVQRFFGYPAATRVTPDWILKRIHPADSGRVAEHLGVLARSQPGSADSFEYRILRADGLERIVESRCEVELAAESGHLIITGVSRDITELKEAEKTAAERDAKYRVLFETARDAILIADKNRYIDFNPAALKMFGYSAEEMRALGPGMISPKHQPDGSLSVKKAAMQNRLALKNKMAAFDWVVQRKNGELVDTNIQLSPFTLENRQCLQVLIRDVSKERRITRQLRDSQRQLELVMGSASMGFWEYFPDKREILLSDQCLHFLGLPKTRRVVPIAKWRELVHPDDLGPVTKLIRHYEETASNAYRTEYRIRARGKYRWVQSFGKLVPPETGRSERMAGIIMDIDAQKTLQRHIDESKTWLQTIVDNASSVIFTKDPAGRYTMVNRKHLQSIGRARGQVVGHTDTELFGAAAAKRLRETDRAVFESGEAVTFESVIAHPDGTDHIYLATKVPLRDPAGKITALICNATDITQLKVMQGQLERARQEAEAASRAKSEFLANMSHEIRTPMNAIIGMSYLTLSSDLSPRQHDHVRRIYESAQSLLGIINDILDFSKIEAGKIAIEHVPFSLNDVVTDIAENSEPRAREKQLRMSLRIAPDVPDRLAGDPLRLKQILNNLVSNAIKFTARGTVEVTIRLRGAATLEFAVKDTGIGMTMDQQRRIFNSFTQGDGSITRRFGGTGLGLVISRQLASLMGGRIFMKSVPGKGSVFTLKLPFKPARAPEVMVSSAGLRGKRVLVIDGNAVAREIICRMLTAMKFDVLGLAAGAQALRRLKADGRAFDFIIADYALAGRERGETVKSIMALNSPSAKLLIMGPDGVKNSVNRSLPAMPAAGFFLSKPVSPSTLFDALCAAGGKTCAAQPGEQRAPSAVPLNGRRVLFVEDQEINQMLGLELLKRLGINVTVACNGRDAVALVKKYNYDAVLLDIQMPVMDGITATRHIRELAQPRAKTLPIIAMTAHAMKGDREVGLAAGMSDYLTKPVDPRELNKRLSRWIGLDNSCAEGLPAIHGVDCAAGLARFAGSEKRYRRALEGFLAFIEKQGKPEKRLAEPQAAVSRYLDAVAAEGAKIAADSVESIVLSLRFALENVNVDKQYYVKEFARVLNNVAASVRNYLAGRPAVSPEFLP